MSTFADRHHLPLVATGVIIAVVAVGCSNGLVTTNPGADPSLTSPTAAASVSPVAPTSAPPSSSPSSSSSSSPSSSPSSSAPPATPTAVRTPDPSTGPSAGDPPATSPSTPPSASGSRTSSSTCTLSDLDVGVRASQGGGAAGSNYVLLSFRNTSGTTCTVYGYPGVSFVGKKNGTQLGVPAVRSSSSRPSTVKLAPGATTTALLQIANAGNYDAQQCAPTSSDGFRVYPPASRTSAYVPFPTQACQRDPGSSKQLTVSPVGTAG